MAAGRATGGPLDPPAGPVGPTGRTLEQLADELARLRGSTPVSTATTPGNAEAHYRITAPGSYHIPSGFAPTSADGSKAVIDITTFDVSLDLNGHELAHVVQQATNAPIVRISPPGGNVYNLRIHNGSIRGSGGIGFTAVQFAGPSRGVILEDLRIVSGRIAGIAGLNQNFFRVEVRRCQLMATSAPAIDLSGCTGAVVESCVFGAGGSPNTVSAVHAGPFARVENCTVSGEAGTDSTGIRVGNGSLVTGCNINNVAINFGATPDVAAIFAGDNCRVERNTITGATRAISLGNNSSASDNSIANGVNSGTGVFCVGGRCSVLRNSLSGQSVGIHCGTVGSNLVMHNIFVQASQGIIANQGPNNLIGTFVNVGNQASQTSPWCNIYLG